MRIYVSILLSFLLHFCLAQQNEPTFHVKKPVVTENTKSEPLYDFNLYPGIDTLDVNQFYSVDITPILGQYDSVSAVNMQLKIKGRRAFLMTPKYNGIGMIKFFKKDTSGIYSLLYVRRFTIAGGSPYTYQRDVKMPDIK
jgi:hypothetical protein